MNECLDNAYATYAKTVCEKFEAEYAQERDPLVSWRGDCRAIQFRCLPNPIGVIRVGGREEEVDRGVGWQVEDSDG